MKKQVLALLLALTMVFSLFPVFASAANSGSCGEKTTWTLDDAGTLTISGNGAMDSYYPYLSSLHDVCYAPWWEVRDTIQRVVIEDGVTEIGRSAFDGAVNLKEISLPDSLTKIGEDVFFGCTSLKAVNLPPKCMEIGTFHGCSALESVTLPPTINFASP